MNVQSGLCEDMPKSFRLSQGPTQHWLVFGCTIFYFMFDHGHQVLPQRVIKGKAQHLRGTNQRPAQSKNGFCDNDQSKSLASFTLYATRSVESRKLRSELVACGLYSHFRRAREKCCAQLSPLLTVILKCHT